MNERVEAFLRDVLDDEGKETNVVRENVSRYLAVYQRMFRDDEPDEGQKDHAAQRCKMLCRERINKEIERCERPQTADVLRRVLDVLDEPERFPRSG